MFKLKNIWEAIGDWFAKVAENEVASVIMVVLVVVLLLFCITLGIMLIKVATYRQNSLLVFVGFLITGFVIGALYYVIALRERKEKKVNNRTKSAKNTKSAKS